MFFLLLFSQDLMAIMLIPNQPKEKTNPVKVQDNTSANGYYPINCEDMRPTLCDENDTRKLDSTKVDKSGVTGGRIEMPIPYCRYLLDKPDNTKPQVVNLYNSREFTVKNGKSVLLSICCNNPKRDFEIYKDKLRSSLLYSGDIRADEDVYEICFPDSSYYKARSGSNYFAKMFDLVSRLDYILPSPPPAVSASKPVQRGEPARQSSDHPTCCRFFFSCPPCLSSQRKSIINKFHYIENKPYSCSFWDSDNCAPSDGTGLAP